MMLDLKLKIPAEAAGTARPAAPHQWKATSGRKLKGTLDRKRKVLLNGNGK
jgi:hypothetical protein